jgi:hypothetical protein
MIGEHTEDQPWQAHCAAIFRRRGLAVLPTSALLFGPTRVGSRLGRPYFIDDDHATIDIEPFGYSNDRAWRVSVERRGSRWVILRQRRPDSWPPTL